MATLNGILICMARSKGRFAHLVLVFLFSYASHAFAQPSAGSPVSNSAPAGALPESTRIADLIGRDDHDPSLDDAVALANSSPEDLRISSDDLASLLVDAIPLLREAGRSEELGLVLKKRADLYLAGQEKDEIWATRSEAYAQWLNERNRRDEARALQEELVKVLGERLGPNNSALLPHLRLLADFLGTGSAYASERSSLGRRLADLQNRENRTDSSIIAMGPAFVPGVGPGQQPIEKVQVYYAANRAPVAPGTWIASDPFFSATPGPMRYGRAEVWVPQRQGDIAQRNTLWAIEVTSATLKRSLVIAPRPISSAETFFARIRADASAGREILVYVHGFNMTFSDALKVTANLAVDLDINGPVVAYCWPSAGSLLGYWRDGRVIRDDTLRLPSQLTELIATLARNNPGARIFLVAHSMGNRIVVPALTGLALRYPAVVLSNVFLASPDIPALTFQSAAPVLARATKNLTLYSSRDDMALRLSSIINGEARAGQPGMIAAGSPGDRIDTTGSGSSLGVERDFLGHNDYMRAALADLRTQIWLSVPITSRCELAASGSYYTFQSARCSIADFTEAVTALHRLPRARALSYAQDRAQLSPAAVDRERWDRIEKIISEIP